MTAEGLVTGPAQVIDQWFADQPELSLERLDRGRGGWLTTLHGERKLAIPVYLELSAQELAMQSFFMRAPDENEAAVYRFLLQRNVRSYIFRFALGPDGDVLILGLLPLPAVQTDELDRALGQLLTLADEAFDPALRVGFETYIDREQAWRARVGAPRNPIS